MRAFVTGAMGFLGQHLVERLHRDDWQITVFDRKRAMEGDFRTTYVSGECMSVPQLTAAMQDAKPDVVFHLAALADVRKSLEMPREQFEQNFLLTQNVLFAMRAAGVSRLAFTSTAVVYGDIQTTPASWAYDPWASTPIDEYAHRFPQQTSIYGAMKLASESLIAAYCHGYGMSADIYRLVSVVGAGYRHGNLMDFYRRLKQNPQTLTLMGSPSQQKFYIDAHDVMDAMMRTVKREHRGAELWNVSHHQPNSIRDAITAVSVELGIKFPELIGGESWPGDLPQLVLDCGKLRALGWSPQVPIIDGMRATVADLHARGVE